jgi:hypothetical protein
LTTAAAAIKKATVPKIGMGPARYATLKAVTPASYESFINQPPKGKRVTTGKPL